MKLTAEQIVAAATTKFDAMCDNYARTGRAQEFDFRDHCRVWTTRSDSFTHRVHRYPGRLTPYVPLFFLSVQSLGRRGGTLLDPFAGCGTVLVESPVHYCAPMNALGLDINPLARLIAKVKTTALDARSLGMAWAHLTARYRRDESRSTLPDFPNKSHWFSSIVDTRLARCLRAISATQDDDVRDFFTIAFSSVIRRVALADPRVSVPVRLKASNYDRRKQQDLVRAEIRQRMEADPFELFAAAVEANRRRLAGWQAAAAESSCSASIVGTDARTFSRSGNDGPSPSSIDGVDLILTSPPYVNAQRYTRSLRLEMFVLGMTDGSKAESVLDQKQIGTERIPFDQRTDLLRQAEKSIARSAIRSIRRVDEYRAAIVAKYVADMDTVMRNCARCLVRGGTAVFIVGNNTVRGHMVSTRRIVRSLAEANGLQTQVEIRNRIPSRGLLTKRHRSADVITHEYAVVVRKPA